MHNTSCAITYERPAEAAALMCPIDGQARKHNDRDRVWHIAPEAPRSAATFTAPEAKA
jgi:hypothetical protein